MFSKFSEQLPLQIEIYIHIYVRLGQVFIKYIHQEEERKVEKANISEEKANNMEEREKNTCYDDGEYNTKRQFSKRIQKHPKGVPEKYF